MFKKIMLVCMLVLGIGIGSAAATDFYAMYDKGPECFMSLDYTLYQGPAPNVFVVKANKPMFERKYLREGGDIWREARTQGEEAIPCCAQGTATPAWLCPAPAPVVLAAVTPPPAVPKEFIVYFDFDKDVLTADAVAVLMEALNYAQDVGYSAIRLESSCDFRGTDEYNIDLGQRRATAVEHWMIENGITATSFAVNNMGEAPERSTEGVYCADCWSDRYVKVTVE